MTTSSSATSHPIEVVLPNSSAIRFLRYEDKSLVVAFTNGNTYRYESVPQNVAAAVIMSESPGTMFNTMIRPRYEGVKSNGLRAKIARTLAAVSKAKKVSTSKQTSAKTASKRAR